MLKACRDAMVVAHEGPTDWSHMITAIDALLSDTPSETAYGWKPSMGESPRQTAWIDDQARYVAIVRPGPRYFLLELPPMPEGK